MEHDHTPEAIEARLAEGMRHNYLRDFVYGGIDGAVTTFAVVGCRRRPTPPVILIMGAANLLADSFSRRRATSWGPGRARRARAPGGDRAEAHREESEGEKEEIRQIIRGKGLEGEVLEHVVDRITGDREVWVRTMLTEEYGLPQEVRSPWRAASSTFVAFLACGLAPLVPFLLGASHAFLIASLLTGAVFFAIGSVKSLWSITSWWRSGMETLLVGAIAAALAYAAGVALKGLS
jgi:hypothetical protein